ncbi:unnamed protein product [Amoebophrya sp. A25]|nr:unnamed protein product [Amoebophrya sp. A25]|eukprot:GSA25T00013177001.1
MSSPVASTTRPLVAVAQMRTTNEHARNFETVSALARAAKQRGASMLLLPEAFAFLGNHFTETVAQAEPIPPISRTFATGVSQHPPFSAEQQNSSWISKYLRLAREHGMWLSLGGYHERPAAASDIKTGAGSVGFDKLKNSMDEEPSAAAPPDQTSATTKQTRASEEAKTTSVEQNASTRDQVEERPQVEKVYNTHLIVDDSGAIRALYRKIHLFDVAIPNGPVLLESRYTIPGCFSSDNVIVVPDTPIGNIGLTTCYDLRFPELYTTLRERGAEVLLVPSAFTVPTGRAHWHLLLQARAVETQCFVLAAAQCGRHNEKRESFGHALAVGPWGDVLADAGSDVDVKLKNTGAGEGISSSKGFEREGDVNSSRARVGTVIDVTEDSCFCLAELDRGEMTKIREKMPIMQHREAAGFFPRL